MTSPCPWDYRIAETEEESFKVREFRDSQLSQSAIGKKYIDYYYDVAEYSDQFSDENWADLKGIKSLILEKVAQFTLNMNDSVFIDTDEKQLFHDIILKLKNVSNDQSYIAMLDNVLADLNYYSNKTVSEIKAEIE